MSRLLDIISKIIRWFVIFLMAVMVVLLFLAVLSRYMFNYSFYWIDAFSRYSLIFISFLGVPIVLRMRQHVNVDVIINLLPSTIKKYIVKFEIMLIFIFSVIMFVQGINLCRLTGKQIIPDLFGIKMSSITIVIPMSALLIILVSLELLFNPNITEITLIEDNDYD